MDRWVDALGLAAGVGGAALAFAMWRRARRHHARARRRHPATTTPITFTVDRGTDGPHWLVRLAGGWPTTAIDIVTWRRSGTDDPWTSEPIVDPVVLAPGATAHLDTPLPDADASYDVVVGWTTRHRNGEVTGSRTLTVPERADEGPAGAAGAAAFRFVYPVVGALLAVVAAVSLLSLVDADADDDEAATPATTSPTTNAPVTTTAATTSPTAAATTDSTSTVAPATTTTTTTTPPSDPRPCLLCS